MPHRIIVCLLLVIAGLTVQSYAQTCEPPQIVFNSKTENIFTPEQEMILGDVMFDRTASEFQVIDDAELTAYLQSIGDRIARNLPDVGLKYKFFLIDMPETNALTMAGGRIMITRKMVSFARNEDELAAVIGHELGHAVVRHVAIDVSKYFKQLLGANSVTDRKDIFEKYNRMLETYATRKVKTSRNHGDNEQLEADKIGIYAAYAAGYDPNVFADFWSRLTDAEEKGLFSRLFGLQTPDDKRLREMVAALKTIPAECRELIADKNKENENFSNWRENVIAFTGLGEKEVLTGLTKKIKLAPLRSEIQYLRFSPNGRYIVAQDYTTITVLSREPLSVLFRIDAPQTLPATFSANSQKLIVRSSYDRVQTWDISSRSLDSVYEFPPPTGTVQTTVSPDGKNILVFKDNGDLSILDVETGKVLYQDNGFYVPGSSESRFGGRISTTGRTFQKAYATIFSSDGRYVILGRRYPANATIMDKFDPFAPITQRRVGPTGLIFQARYCAIDLRNYRRIKVGENVGELLFNGGSFLGNDRLVGKVSYDMEKSGIFAFPSGERIQKFELSGVRFTAAHAGDYITVSPIANAPTGVFDLKRKAFIIASRREALDVYDDVFVSELPSGELAVRDVNSTDIISKIDLPPSPLGAIRTVSLSENAQWLVLSETSRGAGWDLTTGKPLFGMRYFSGSFITPDGIAYTDFPEDSSSSHTVARIDLTDAKVSPGSFELPDAAIRQYGRYLLARSSKFTDSFFKTRRSKEYREKAVAFDPYMNEPSYVGFEDITFRLMDSTTGKTLWTREFKNEAPQYIFDTAHDVLTFYWRANQKAAKKIIDDDPKLKQASKREEFSDYDIVVEAVDTASGHVRDRVLIYTGEGSFTPRAVWASGKYLTVVDTANRTLIYSVSTGKLLHRFFGSSSEMSVKANLIAVENPTGWINIYNLETGERKERLGFTSPIVYLNFLDDGQKLFVLTAEQIAYIFDTTKFNGKNLKRPLTTIAEN